MRVTYFLFATVLIAQQVATDSNVTFRSQAREVLLEVVVRDAHGKLVTKIDPAQVSVYEDGILQSVKSFRLIPGREVHAEAEKQMAQAATTEQKVAPGSGTRPPSNPLRTQNIVCLILNDLTPDTRAFAFDAAKKFVNKELRPDTFIGVFALDASGLRPVYPFSNNRERLLKAVELASVNQLPTLAESTAAMLNGFSMMTTGVSGGINAALNPLPTISQSTAALLNGINPATPGISGGFNEQGTATDPLGTRGDMGVAVSAGLREIDALSRMVKQLSELPFQKTVLLMSTGLTRPPDQLEYWKSVISQANKGGITFYSVDVWGLAVCQDSAVDCNTSSSASGSAVAMLQSTAGLSQTQSTVGLSAKGPYAPGGSSVNGPSPTMQLAEASHQSDFLRYGVLSANTQEALREIAESTGGFIIANTNNTEALLAKVMEDVDTHYELAYQPVSTRSDGRFHKIEVKVAGKDLRVQTRSGYYAVPETGEGPLTAGDMGALAALNTTPRPHAFEFGSNAYRFRSASGTAQYSIAFEVPIASLTGTVADKKHRYHAYLLALVKNAQGDIVERVSKDVPSEVDEKHMAGLVSDTMIYEHAVNLSPGKYTVETAVVDQEGNRASTGVLQIDNRNLPGPGLSDITLVRRVHNLDRLPDPLDPFEIPGKRAQPSVTTALAAGVQPYIYFVVYPEQENREAPLLRAQFIKDGRVMATQKSELPLPDSSGAVPMAIQAKALPGDYEVKITIDQGRRSVQRSLKYSIAAK